MEKVAFIIPHAVLRLADVGENFASLKNRALNFITVNYSLSSEKEATTTVQGSYIHARERGLVSIW